MEFKVDYITVLGIGNDLLKETNELEETLEHMLTLIEELNSCWKGIDYENFANNASVYIKNLNFNIQELKFLSNFIKLAAGKYSDSDLEFARRIRKVGDDKEWNLG